MDDSVPIVRLEEIRERKFEFVCLNGAMGLKKKPSRTVYGHEITNHQLGRLTSTPYGIHCRYLNEDGKCDATNDERRGKLFENTGLNGIEKLECYMIT